MLRYMVQYYGNERSAVGLRKDMHMWTIGEVKEKGKALMHVSYWKMVLLALILVFVIGGGVSTAAAGAASSPSANVRYEGNLPMLLVPLAGLLISAVLIVSCVQIVLQYFIFHPIETGCRRYQVVAHTEGASASLGEIFHCFGPGFLNVVLTMFLRDLFTFLWSLLFVIPGIVKSYSYRLVPYILAEEPNISSKEAFRLSREMMNGNKWHAFLFDLSFIGWNILSACTLGILGIFYVHPYYQCASAELYLTMRDAYLGGRAEGGDTV